MANIPGVTSALPGVYARDRVISRGTSVPGGLRTLCIMGEGLREETIVDAAVGNGEDGSSDCAPDGDPAGRFFKLQFAPVISGRSEIYLNGSPLYGKEEAIDDLGFEGIFDFRLDPETGCFELQGASIGDQGGKKYSSGSLNVGNGYVVDGDSCGEFDLISVLDKNAPAERWTVRCISVSRDSVGNIIPGRSTFTATGSVSGQLRNQNGQPILFHSAYYTNNTGATSANSDIFDDGFVVAENSMSGFGDGEAVLDPDDQTSTTTNKFKFSGNLITQGQALVGDYLCTTNGPDDFVIQITDIEYDSGNNETTLTLKTDTLDATLTGVDWKIRAVNVFIDDYTVAHDELTGAPASEGSFTSSDIGKVLAICDGVYTSGLYKIKALTSSRRLRIESLSDDSVAYPNASEGSQEGLSETGRLFHILETNGVLLFALKEGSIPFAVGDKFFIDVKSRVLKKNDRLEARYISEADINDPEVFVSAGELEKKHGRASVTNTISLGSQLAFENGAPQIMTLQCKPAVARRTSQVLIEEKDSSNRGGYSGCGASPDCEADDLTFVIPRPLSGLIKGRPDIDTQVNIFVIRGGEETQIFPNKVPFYSSQFETPSGQDLFINGSSYEFSYTIINTQTKITGNGVAGNVFEASGTFTSSEINFDAADVGRVIVIQSISDGVDTFTTEDDVSTQLFGSTGMGIELKILSIVNDNTVTVEGNLGGDPIDADGVDARFYIKDEADTSNVSSALLLHKSIVESGNLIKGDGLKITYIDEVDADFYDANWFEAFEQLESREVQMVVPLPSQNRSGIFRLAVNHVESMSTIAIQKERIALIGAQRGVSPAALLGQEEVAVEDVGILEGIQGDDVEELLSQNIEDLMNMKLGDNYTSNRCVYFYPDEIIRNINGTNTVIDGYYVAAAAAGYFAANQNIAIPLTYKVLSGFTIARTKILRPTILSQLYAEGVTVLQPVTGGGRVVAARTTSNSGFVEDEEISVMFIRDRVKQALRNGMQGFIGTAQDVNTNGVITSRAKSIMSALLSQNIITDFRNLRVEKDKVDPRQVNIYVRFTPSYPLNYIFIDIEVSAS